MYFFISSIFMARKIRSASQYCFYDDIHFSYQSMWLYPNNTSPFYKSVRERSMALAKSALEEYEAILARCVLQQKKLWNISYKLAICKIWWNFIINLIIISISYGTLSMRKWECMLLQKWLYRTSETRIYEKDFLVMNSLSSLCSCRSIRPLPCPTLPFFQELKAI